MNYKQFGAISGCPRVKYLEQYSIPRIHNFILGCKYLAEGYKYLVPIAPLTRKSVPIFIKGAPFLEKRYKYFILGTPFLVPGAPLAK